MFEAAMGTARTRQGSRNGADANVAPPDTKRSYALRSSVVCHLCDGRMFGKTHHGNPYYSCQPGGSQGSIGRERDPNHPPTVYVREEALLDGDPPVLRGSDLRSQPPETGADGKGPRKNRFFADE